jgi:hypothetical protein
MTLRPEIDRSMRSRAFGPGSRRLQFAVLAVAAVAAAVVTYAVWPGSSGGRYGQIPSWLPKAKVQVGRVVTASAAHPWLAIQGDTVDVDLAGGRVAATAVGPVVPEEGRFPVPKTSPCSFTVTFTAASGVVPLSARSFTFLDELGHLHQPKVTAIGGGALPARVLPGQTISLVVSGVLPTGGGRLRWAPAGTKPVVSWDFDVEID